MNIDATKLKGILDCMDAEADERDKHSAQIRDIVKKAKSDGFETKALRKVWQRRRMDAETRQHDDDLLDLYEHALGAKGVALRAIEAGAKVGEAAADAGVHRATVARARHVAKQASSATAPPHDPITGEIEVILWEGGETTPQDSTELHGLMANAGDGGETAATRCRPSPTLTTPQDGTAHYCRECEGTGRIVYDDGERIHGYEECPVCRVDPEPEPVEVGAVAEAEPKPHQDPTSAKIAQVGDGLEIPSFLDKRNGRTPASPSSRGGSVVGDGAQ